MQRLSVSIGFLLAALILAVGHFVAHVAEGPDRLLLFLLAAVVFCICAFAWPPHKP